MIPARRASRGEAAGRDVSSSCSSSSSSSGAATGMRQAGSWRSPQAGYGIACRPRTARHLCRAVAGRLPVRPRPRLRQGRLRQPRGGPVGLACRHIRHGAALFAGGRQRRAPKSAARRSGPGGSRRDGDLGRCLRKPLRRTERTEEFSLPPSTASRSRPTTTRRWRSRNFAATHADFSLGPAPPRETTG